jgi:hypothetical protein
LFGFDHLDNIFRHISLKWKTIFFYSDDILTIISQ